MKATIVDFSRSFAGKQRVTFETDEDAKAQLGDLFSLPCEVSVKKYREKRTLDANAYAWVLIDKISAKMNLTKAEVYRDHIRGIGGVSETVCVQDKAVEKLTEAWKKNGLGWQAETFPSKIKGCTNVTLYYGSSVYDSEQMSRLIDSLVETCKSLGIETMPPEKLAAMMKEYET